jgi:hypothetical protein
MMGWKRGVMNSNFFPSWKWPSTFSCFISFQRRGRGEGVWFNAQKKKKPP